MNPDAKVKMRGVQVGKVPRSSRSPTARPRSIWRWTSRQLHLIPGERRRRHHVVDGVRRQVRATGRRRRTRPRRSCTPGQVIQGQHVTVEINTVFQQLVTVLDKIDPAKLNETLGAIATAFNGRGEKFGQTLSTSTRCWPRSNRACRISAHDIEALRADAQRLRRRGAGPGRHRREHDKFSNTIVDQQQNLDEFLVSTIGLADTGNDVIGGNRQALTDDAARAGAHHRLAQRVPRNISVRHRGLIPFAKSRHRQYPGVMVNASLTLGVERYRYPEDLPEGRGHQRRPSLQGTGPARSAAGTSGRRSSSATSAPIPRSTATRASCSTPTRSSSGCSGRSTGRRATPRRSGCRDDADRGARSSSSASSRVVMVVLTAFLFVVFGEYRTGATNDYSAVFADASRLEAGDTVRVAGIRVGTVQDVRCTPTATVLVEVRRRPQHQADHRHQGRDPLSQPGRGPLSGTRRRARVHQDPAGRARRYPIDRTAPALDLDLLLGGLKPVIQGLNPQDVNALSASLIQILQGQGGTLESLFSRTSSFSNSLADNNQVIEQLIDNLKTMLDTLSKDGDEFSGAIDKLEQLVAGLSEDRDPIGDGHHVAGQRHRLACRPARPGAAAAGRHGRPAQPARAVWMRTRPPSTPPSSDCPRSTASWLGWAPTARSSRTTSAESASGPAISRAAPSNSPGSSKRREGARSSNAQIPRIRTSSGPASSASS